MMGNRLMAMMHHSESATVNEECYQCSRVIVEFEPKKYYSATSMNPKFVQLCAVCANDTLKKWVHARMTDPIYDPPGMEMAFFRDITTIMKIISQRECVP